MSTAEARRAANRRFYERHKEAEKARAKKWRKDNPEKYKAWAEKNKSKRQAASRKHYHNITDAQFQAKMVEQDGKCAICRKPLVSPDVDHNHGCCPSKKSCGQCNRGLLCRSCNTFIGLAEESEEILGNAIQYLRSYQ